MDTERKLINLFDSMYGRDFMLRTNKLREECLELVEAIDNLSFYPNETELDKFVDEMSDVEAVITHTSSVVNITREDLLSMAIDKVEKRVNNPNYKR